MKAMVLSLLGVLVSSAAFAGPVLPASSQQKGINETITINQLSPGVWGNTFELSGFYNGTGVNKLIPVSREAAAVLRSLDSKLRYNCVIQNSTHLPERTNGQDLGSTYYVLDINCD